MTKAEAKERILKLKSLINRYRYARLVLNREQIPPGAEDALKKELFDLESQFPDLVTPDSPTQRVAGKPLKAFRKVQHEKPMLSFNDAFSEQDLKEWITRLENHLGRKVTPEFYCELKIDGLAIELVYQNGIFVEGSTRGDGLVGEDVTQNLKTVEVIPLRLEGEVPQRVVVRGEVFITKREFRRVNREQEKRGEKTFANPRNMAAGSVRQLDPRITASRKLDSFAYAIVTDLGGRCHEEAHTLLKRFGFKTNPHNTLVHSLAGVIAFRNRWEKQREKLPYEIDGVVVIVNDNKTFDAAGVIGKAPRAAIAYKFSPREATTVVEDIIVRVGRTGALTPVAKLKPVAVGGVTISSASLHNADEVARLGVKIGDTVIVSRAGDVIPQVTKVLKELRTGKERRFTMPTRCPVDGSKVVKEGAIHRCANPHCGARHREELHHFVSRSAFDIRGLGHKIIDRFLDEGLIGDAADIFTLKGGDIAALERFGEKSAQNLIREIAAHTEVALSRFLYSLGILHVGEETAIDLAEHFGTLEKLMRASPEDLRSVPNIGEVVARAISAWFRDRRNRALVSKLLRVGVKIKRQRARGKEQKLKGVTFVLTGGMETMTRDEAKLGIRALGGNVSESVRKRVDYVVVGSEPGAKLERARALGVKTISEEKFRTLIAKK